MKAARTTALAVAAATLTGSALAGPANGAVDPLARPQALPNVHAVVKLTDGAGKPHTLEVWRTNGRVRRRVDDRLEIHAIKTISGIRYRVLDLAKHREFLASEVSLVRLGIFTRWDELVSLIARPTTKAAALPRPATTTKLGACAWVKVQDKNVCWSRAKGLALFVEHEGDHASVRDLEVVTLDGAVTPQDLQGPDTHDFAVLDADEELGGTE